MSAHEKVKGFSLLLVVYTGDLPRPCSTDLGICTCSNVEPLNDLIFPSTGMPAENNYLKFNAGFVLITEKLLRETSDAPIQSRYSGHTACLITQIQANCRIRFWGRACLQANGSWVDRSEIWTLLCPLIMKEWLISGSCKFSRSNRQWAVWLRWGIVLWLLSKRLLSMDHDWRSKYYPCY